MKKIVIEIYITPMIGESIIASTLEKSIKGSLKSFTDQPHIKKIETRIE